LHYIQRKHMKKLRIALGDRHSLALLPEAAEAATAIVEQLDLPAYGAVLAVVGSAGSLGPQLLPRLRQLFGQAVARAAQQATAVLVDGGTQAGVMALLGEAVAALGYATPLVGVAPAALVSYPPAPEPATAVALEPHHSHFVLTPGAKWGDETSTLFGVVRALRGPTRQARPAALLLVGGGAVAHTELLAAVRLGLPIVVLAGTGGLADELAAAWPTRSVVGPLAGSTLTEIMANGHVQFYSLEASAEGLKAVLLHYLSAAAAST
jgi:hypothetical protein